MLVLEKSGDYFCAYDNSCARDILHAVTCNASVAAFNHTSTTNIIHDVICDGADVNNDDIPA